MTTVRKQARKVCFFTGARSDYGLLYPLLKQIKGDDSVELQLIVGASHLSEDYGLTVSEIENDGFQIDAHIEMDLASDDEGSACGSIGSGLDISARIIAEMMPDVLVILGDRYELLCLSIAALFARLPVAHIGGGQLTEGAMDDPIRHVLTKLSHLHFTATETYRKRIIQLGERPDRVFAVGSLGVDNIINEKFLERGELEESIGFSFGNKNLLVTYHPETLGSQPDEVTVQNLLHAIDSFPDVKLIFTMPNADPGRYAIWEKIQKYVNRCKDRAIAITSLGRTRYLSVLNYVDGVVGNSSSGIIEAPSFRIGTVNIGDRQKGRIMPSSVINCGTSETEIQCAIKQLFSSKFSHQLKNTINPYGTGNAASQIHKILRTYPLSRITKKQFYDVDFVLPDGR